MITFFSSPRSFHDPHIITIQKNAIASWQALPIQKEILLIGDDEGVAKVAKEYGITHITGVKKTNAGIPWRNEVFKIAATRAYFPILVFVSSDIILTDSITNILKNLPSTPFLLTARRYDLDITTPINFSDPNWQAHLLLEVKTNGKLHGPSAIDFALYHKNLSSDFFAPFPMNLPGWDNYFLYRCKHASIDIIDATEILMLIHQNHNHRTHKGTKNNVWHKDIYAKQTLKTIGGFSHMLTLREADYVLLKQGLEFPPFPRNLLSVFARYQLYCEALGLKRYLKQYFV